MRYMQKSAIAGAALLSLASAYPAGAPSPSATPSSSGIAVPSFGFATQSGSAAPVHSTAASSSTLVPKSFPDLSPQDLNQVQILAHGTEPNSAPPPSLSDQGAINLQLIEYNENFEVAFFSSFISNITNNVPGFEISDPAQKTYVVNALTAHLNQEIEHAFNARSALTAFKRTTINPCKYKFPTTTGKDATKLAKTFTDVVLGTLQDVSVIFAENGDTQLPGLIGSVIGQEGEQNGFYRLLENDNLIPASLPFLTRSTRDFAFSALVGFVDGQCDGTNTLIQDGLKLFGTLNLLTPGDIQGKDQNLKFSFDVASLKNSANLDFHSGSYSGSQSYQSWWSGNSSVPSGYDWSKSGLFLTYINQQNVPVSVPLQNPSISGTVVTFEAQFPFQATLMNGLSIAAVTIGNNFTDARAVAKNTLFAPALIEVN